MKQGGGLKQAASRRYLRGSERCCFLGNVPLLGYRAIVEIWETVYMCGWLHSMRIEVVCKMRWIAGGRRRCTSNGRNLNLMPGAANSELARMTLFAPLGRCLPRAC